MPLSIGQRIGQYEVISQLGAGGMGEVYRARDSKLKRDVAIKVLPADVANDRERLARFQREAEVLASLNHPYIAHVYGIEDGALVMELVDGDDLSQRIARGAIPIDDAMPIAKQIAEALEAAHDAGIVHRDLKPGNIKVRADGTVKVLDFGLAKAGPQDLKTSGPHDLSNSPTITSPAMTMRGVILGTAAYMSPEQAKGKAVDKRADIWAFGCVLFEMLTGTRAFKGDDVTDIITSVMRDTPDWNALPGETPGPIRRLLTRCLEKDPRRRAGHLSIARLEIDDASATEPFGESVRGTPVASRREWVAWALAGVLAVTVAMLIGRPSPAPLAEAAAARFALTLTGDLQSANIVSVLPSPDGRRIAVQATQRLSGFNTYVRDLDGDDFRPVPIAGSGRGMAWSADSSALLLAIDEEIWSIDISSGARRTMARFGKGPRGFVHSLAQNSTGTLLAGLALEPLQIARTPGATLEPLTTLDAANAEIEHRFPVFFPDGRRYFVASVRSASVVAAHGSIDGSPPTPLDGFDGMVLWAGDQSIVFRRDDRLYAQRFNYTTLRLEGEAVELAANAPTPEVAPRQAGAGAAATAVAYRVGRNAAQRFTWYSREGKPLDAIGELSSFGTFDLSNDGSKIVVVRREPTGSNLWSLDTAKETLSRVTVGTTRLVDPRLSGDGRLIIAGAEADPSRSPHQVAASGGDPARLFRFPGRVFSNDDWSADNRWLLYHDAADPQLYASDLTRPSEPPIPVAKSLTGIIDQAAMSRDTRWVAYNSNESGEWQVYVVPFPPTGERWQVSLGGGVQPMWRADGRELYFLALNGELMAARISPGPAFAAGAPERLFTAPLTGATPSVEQYAVSADGSRFLFLTNERSGAREAVHVLTNWMSLLKGPTP
jgi:eukaryotic-like serine/threonine-protein kinase